MTQADLGLCPGSMYYASKKLIFLPLELGIILEFWLWLHFSLKAISQSLG